MLAAGLQDWVDFGVICALLLLNATVGFVQEFQAGSIVEELKKTLALKAVVVVFKKSKLLWLFLVISFKSKK